MNSGTVIIFDSSELFEGDDDNARKNVGTEGLVSVSVLSENLPMLVIYIEFKTKRIELDSNDVFDEHDQNDLLVSVPSHPFSF